MPLIGSFGSASGRGFGRGGGQPKRLFDILFVAGGGSGSPSCHSTGGGGGGMRTSWPGGTQLEIDGKTTYTVSIGAGGTGAPGSGGGPPIHGTQRPGVPGGNAEIYLSAPNVLYYSTGGGCGNGGYVAGSPGGAGGGSNGGAGGAGNAGGFSPPEGAPGGNSSGNPDPVGGGGGGGGASGATVNNGNGGNGTSTDITGSSVTYAGGGGGGWYAHGSGLPGGSGGGGTNQGTTGGSGSNGLGGGGSGGGPGPSSHGGNGGSGRIVFRYPSEFSTTVAPGTNTITDHPGGDKLATFNVSGTLSVD